MTSQPTLARRLGLGDAVAIGLGSMIGAGVFAVFAPAAQAANSGLLIGLAIAAIVAFCNATSSAQLAAQYPNSGGTYVSGRARLGDWSGFFAGWSFVIGKTASCASMALTFGAYVVPEPWQKPLAITAVLALMTINLHGITRSAALTRVIVVIVLAVLALVVVLGLSGESHHPIDLAPEMIPGGWYGVLQSAGLLFFAFAGYARLATLGEEVKNPSRTIPSAILVALGIGLIVYTVTAATALLVLGPERLASSTAPLNDAVVGAGFGWASPVVRVGAATAALGALLALLAGIGRTWLAMARNADLPPWLAAVHPVSRVPHRAEIAVAIVVCVVIACVDLRGAIGFSSFGVLLYYAVANLAAFTQERPQRRFPKGVQVLGMVGCVLLVATLPIESIAAGIGVLAVGLLVRLLFRRRPPHSSPRKTRPDPHP